MATLNACLDSIQQHIGFSRSRSSGISRRLQESKLLPSGAPGVPPELDERDVCLLLATLMSAPMLHEAVDHARAYTEMTPGGAVLSADAPDSIPRSALQYLTVEALMVASDLFELTLTAFPAYESTSASLRSDNATAARQRCESAQRRRGIR